MCTFFLSSLFVTHDFYRACTAGFPTSCFGLLLVDNVSTAASRATFYASLYTPFESIVFWRSRVAEIPLTAAGNFALARTIPVFIALPPVTTRAAGDAATSPSSSAAGCSAASELCLLLRSPFVVRSFARYAGDFGSLIIFRVRVRHQGQAEYGARLTARGGLTDRSSSHLAIPHQGDLEILARTGVFACFCVFSVCLRYFLLLYICFFSGR